MRRVVTENQQSIEENLEKINIKSKKNNNLKKSKLKKILKNNTVFIAFLLPAIFIYTFFYIAPVF